MITAHYSPYCLCTHCSAHTFFELGRSALGDEQFVKRSERYKLNEEQRSVIVGITRELEEKKLVEWNMMAKGERV
jgi:hypothetical protein